MGSKVELSPLTVEDNSSYQNGLNQRLDRLADEFDNVVYRDGSQDLQGHQNANSKRIYNLGTPVAMSDAARLQDVQDMLGALQGNSDFALQFQKAEHVVTEPTESQFEFSFAALAGYVSVHLNGVKLATTDYSHSGAVITLNTPAVAGDIIALEGFTVAAVVPTPSSITYTSPGTGAIARTLQTKLEETVSIKDFGASPDATAAVNSAAIKAAMTALLNRFADDVDYYLGGPGDATDFYDVNRQTGTIVIPAGRYYVLPEVFSDVTHARAPFVGFNFKGEGKMHSILEMETGGVESWFYNNNLASNYAFQQITFEDLGFRSDNWRYGSVFKMYSEGGPKQCSFIRCDFEYMQKLLETHGTGNADLTLFRDCTGHFYNNVLTLNNDQSVVHNFESCHFGTYDDFIRVKQFGGGNVVFSGCSLDFIYHVDYSPIVGGKMFSADSDANIGQGNNAFKFENCRVEIEAYMRTAGDPPIMLVEIPDNGAAMPRVTFDNVSWVNGATATIDADGNILSSNQRRITAVKIANGKSVEFRNCTLLKNFFYEINSPGGRDVAHAGGIIRFTNCYDGTVGELPAADSTKINLHDRVTYTGSSGRVITEGMTEHTTGNSYERKLLDADPNWRFSVSREPASTKKMAWFKHIYNGWPVGPNSSNDHYLDIPPNLLALRIYVKKPATGASTDAYQLHLKTTNRSGTILGSSTLAQFKDEHVIDLNHQDLTGVTRICLCASGVWNDYYAPGIAYIEYV